MVATRNWQLTGLGNGRFALDCFLSPVQIQEAGGLWRDINPSLRALGGGLWGPTDTPYHLEIDRDGGRKFFPDKGDRGKYVSLPGLALFRGLPRTIAGNTITLRGSFFDIVTRAENTRVKLSIIFRSAPPFTTLSFPVDTVGLALGQLLGRSNLVDAKREEPH